jgi:hypothetical protein
MSCKSKKSIKRKRGNMSHHGWRRVADAMVVIGGHAMQEHGHSTAAHKGVDCLRYVIERTSG